MVLFGGIDMQIVFQKCAKHSVLPQVKAKVEVEAEGQRSRQ